MFFVEEVVDEEASKPCESTGNVEKKDGAFK